MKTLEPTDDGGGNDTHADGGSFPSSFKSCLHTGSLRGAISNVNLKVDDATHSTRFFAPHQSSDDEEIENDNFRRKIFQPSRRMLNPFFLAFATVSSNNSNFEFSKKISSPISHIREKVSTTFFFSATRKVC